MLSEAKHPAAKHPNRPAERPRRFVFIRSVALVLLVAFLSACEAEGSSFVSKTTDELGLEQVAEGRDDSGSGRPTHYWLFTSQDTTFARLKPAIDDSIESSGWTEVRPANQSFSSYGIFAESQDKDDCATFIDLATDDPAAAPYADPVLADNPGLEFDDAPLVLLVLLGECV